MVLPVGGLCDFRQRRLKWMARPWKFAVAVAGRETIGALCIPRSPHSTPFAALVVALALIATQSYGIAQTQTISTIFVAT
jgi:hypothetical protein